MTATLTPVSFSRDDVLFTLEELGPAKTLSKIFTEIAAKKGVTVDQIPRETVRSFLEDDFEKIPSLIEKWGEGEDKKWKIHFMK